MTKKEKLAYKESKILINILQKALSGKKFRLDCGHHITFNTVLGNDLTVRNGKELKVICAQCGY